MDENIYPVEALPIVDYYEDTWIGRPGRRNTRRPPKFEIEMWSCFERVQEDLPKTNNVIEGWHRTFLHQVSGCHPTIWKFLAELRREQAPTEINIEKLLGGIGCNTGRKKYRKSAERLKSLTDKFFEYQNVIDYLRAISYHFSL